MKEKQEKTTPNESYSLKKYRLKQWIAMHSYTQTFVAKKLGLDIVEFKRKLSAREPFNKEQISALIELVGLREAYHIIYFPHAETPKEDDGERHKEDR